MRSFFGSSAFFRFRQEVLCRCRNLHLQSFSWSGDKLVHSKVFTKAGEDGVRTEAADLHYYYDAEDRPALLTYNGTRFMYQYNLQGDIIGMIAGHHTKVLRYEYDAWGKQLSCTGSRKDDMGVQNPFRYRHYQYDVETGLYYLNSRYYSPELGRFISADVLISTGYSVFTHNQYCYCLNNPIMLIDEDGAWPDWGYYHRKVQEHFSSMHTNIVIPEIHFNLGNKKFGRADLVNTESGEIWEVKPMMAAYFRMPEKKLNSALNQLAKYVNGTPFGKRAEKIKAKELKTGGFIPFQSVPLESGELLLYWCIGDGIIWYQVFSKKREPELVPEYKAAPERFAHAVFSESGAPIPMSGGVIIFTAFAFLTGTSLAMTIIKE